MRTSYFFRGGFGGARTVSIALWQPKGYTGEAYPALAPTRKMLKMGEDEYRAAYQAILNRLDPRKVYADLGENAVLLCWEPPGEFCHRRLVAEWLEVQLGIKVPELGEDERQGKLFR
jgi:hypothetical protein